MDFFQSQESLTSIEWILRAVVAFLFLFFMAKIMGQRSISQLQLLDFIIALSIGNIIAHPLSDEGLGLKGSMITMTVLVTLYLIGVFASLKWKKLRHFIDTPSFSLIENGKIISKNLKRARISIDFLLSELRKEKIEDVQKIALALWEPDGTISFFLHSQYQAMTPADMNIVTKPFTFPSTIIKEGKIEFKELHRIGKNENWLKHKVKSLYDADIHDILLGTIDQNDQLKIFLYH
ncbi:DUF421 domain-containing protein [Bacillus sp. JJ634]